MPVPAAISCPAPTPAPAAVPPPRRKTGALTLALALLLAAPAALALSPDHYLSSGDYCKAEGAALGPRAASRACETAKQMCSSVQGAPLTSSIGAVSLPQCRCVAVCRQPHSQPPCLCACLAST